MSAKGLKRLSATRFCGELISEYCREIDQRFKDVFSDAIYDYIELVAYVRSRGADPGLKTAYYKQELDIKALMGQYEIERARFCRMERETRILTDQEMFSYEETRYMRIDVAPAILKDVRAFADNYPYLYGRKKKTTMINVVDHSILFRIMLNSGILDNKFYRELRINRLIESERSKKKDITYVFKKIY